MIKLTSKALAPIILTMFFGGILGSMALNLWITESSKVPVKYSEGEFAGVANPADIRGSYSLGDIESNFGIPVAVSSRAFGAADWPNPADFKAKDLETLYGPAPDGGEIGTDSVRLFVARYLGLPYSPEETTRLPLAAIRELEAKLAPADLKALQKIAVDPASFPSGEGEVSAGAGTAAPTETAGSAEATASAKVSESAPAETTSSTETHATSEDRTIKGNTTFADLLSWGVGKATIEEIMGMSVSVTSVTVRDFCLEKGVEFSDYKTRLQAAIPAK